MTVGVSDGERLYAVRYASGRVVANSLFVSNDVRDVRSCIRERALPAPRRTRRAPSSPSRWADLPGVWRKVPSSTALVVQPGRDEELAFTPRA